MTQQPQERDNKEHVSRARVYGKHLFAYVPAAFRILVVAAIIYCIFWFDASERLVSILKDEEAALSYAPEIRRFGNVALALFFLAHILADIYRILVLASTRITIDADGVCYRSGIFPWNAHIHYWRDFQIFSSSFEQSGFTNWLFDIGGVVITGKEGVTSQFSVSSIWRPRECCGYINALVKQ